MPTPSAAPLLVEIREAARLLGLSTRTVWQLAKDGELPAISVGRARRFPVAGLQEYVERKAGGKS